jgi:hypothetical protein
MGLGRLLIVDDDRSFAANLKVDGERLGLSSAAARRSQRKAAIGHRDTQILPRQMNAR